MMFKVIACKTFIVWTISTVCSNISNIKESEGVKFILNLKLCLERVLGAGEATTIAKREALEMSKWIS